MEDIIWKSLSLRIFQDVEILMKIQTRSGNGRRHYTSLCKEKIMSVRSSIRSNVWDLNHFIFKFTTMLIKPGFQPSSSLANITKITRTWNKTDATPVLSSNKIFRRREFNFVNRFKRDFEEKTWKDFRDFVRDWRIKRQNNRIETWIRMIERVVRVLEFVQNFFNDRNVVAPREKTRDFK